MIPASPLAFPAGFVWGTATSAFQIEGASRDDGRGPSIWDTFCRVPGRIKQGAHAEVAADHYHRLDEDLQVMAGLGVNAYRFSVSWPRVLPQGRGPVNQKGLDFYDRLVDGLLSLGITPYLTLYHWDLPQALQDEGGWPTRGTVEAFGEYAAQLGARLGDRVRHWITHNEPMVTALVGHFSGDHAPGMRDPAAALRVGLHLAASHGLADQALRATSRLPLQVGVALNLSPVHPASGEPEDVAAAWRFDLITNRFFLDPFLVGRYPEELKELFAMVDPQGAGLVEVGLRPVDFAGVNYYSRAVVRHDPDFPVIAASVVQPPGREYSGMWEVYPEGLTEILSRVWRDYGPQAPRLRLLVTENGIPVPDGLDLDGRVRDERRVRYLRDHLMALHGALEAGVPVDGYFVWSLLDNFEWAHGYDMRFGLVHVDFASQVRTVKDSGKFFASVARGNCLSAALAEPYLPR